ncbi:hypothetical protein AB0J74_27330 [Asanoa sp. NPDC049573]|uniref:hypothetical protein n=1 Tax=Asanoa sp. NPDC049573 TaxID=3155396 RepID=UPI003414585D
MVVISFATGQNQGSVGRRRSVAGDCGQDRCIAAELSLAWRPTASGRRKRNAASTCSLRLKVTPTRQECPRGTVRAGHGALDIPGGSLELVMRTARKPSDGKANDLGVDK